MGEWQTEKGLEPDLPYLMQVTPELAVLLHT